MISLPVQKAISRSLARGFMFFASSRYFLRALGSFFPFLTLDLISVLFPSINHISNKNGLLLIYLVIIHRSSLILRAYHYYFFYVKRLSYSATFLSFGSSYLFILLGVFCSIPFGIRCFRSPGGFFIFCIYGSVRIWVDGHGTYSAPLGGQRWYKLTWFIYPIHLLNFVTGFVLYYTYIPPSTPSWLYFWVSSLSPLCSVYLFSFLPFPHTRCFTPSCSGYPLRYFIYFFGSSQRGQELWCVRCRIFAFADFVLAWLLLHECLCSLVYCIV